MSEKDIKEMRKKFCCLYAMLGDAEEAAVRAGFSREEALEKAAACLKAAACKRTVEELRKVFIDGEAVLSGLRRLAFGSCNDGVLLAFADELPPPETLEKLDLFNISEIKRVRGGGVEVKMFDRMKALEKLYELENIFADRSKASGLIEALAASAEREEE